MSWSMRNPNKMAKTAIMSSNASCVKEWLLSCFLHGPFLRVVVLSNIDLQWGCGRFGVDNSPSTGEEDPVVVNPCILKWSCSRGKRTEMPAWGMLCRQCGCGFVVGMLVSKGKILNVLHGIGEVMG